MENYSAGHGYPSTRLVCALLGLDAVAVTALLPSSPGTGDMSKNIIQAKTSHIHNATYKGCRWLLFLHVPPYPLDPLTHPLTL